MRSRLMRYTGRSPDTTSQHHRQGAMHGYLLPAVIALGLGISTISVFALQVVSQNSATLNTQSYNQLAREAARAGIAATQACILETPNLIGETATWTSGQLLSPGSGCTPAATGSGFVIDNSSSSDQPFKTTYAVSKPTPAPGDTTTPASTLVVTSVGKLQLPVPGGSGNISINETLHAYYRLGTSSSSGSYKQSTVISTGTTTACAIARSAPTSTDDWAYCWGSNSNGALGNGFYYKDSRSVIPVAVLQGPSIAQTSNTTNTCTASGTSKCAAANPSAVDLTGKRIIDISVGSTRTCMVAADSDGTNGRAYCWGENGNGQLGDGTTKDSKIPVAVDTTPYQAKFNAPCGGFGQPSCYNKPASSLMGKDVRKVSVGDSFTCALAADGSVSCWGQNDNGQLGNDTRTDSRVPVAVNTGAGSALGGGKQVKSLARLHDGTATMCVTDTDDKAYCWGQNYAGQTGNNTTHPNISKSGGPCTGGTVPPALVIDTSHDALSPVAVATSMKMSDIDITTGSSGNSVSYVNSIYNSSGSIWERVTAKALDGSGSGHMYWWGGSVSYSRTRGVCSGGGGAGAGNNGYYGYANQAFTYQSTPAGPLYDSGTLNLALDLVAGNPYDGYFCTKPLTGSTTYCDMHGDNATLGQYGDGKKYTSSGSCKYPTAASTPLAVTTVIPSVVGCTPPTGPPNGFGGLALSALALGQDYACAVGDGQLYCWGQNNVGQLGRGPGALATTASNYPVPVSIDGTVGSALSQPGNSSGPPTLTLQAIY